MTDFTARVRQTDEGPVVAVDGELDHATASDLQAILADVPLASGELLVIDLAALRFCDSSGLAVFLAARNRAVSLGARIALSGVPAHTARVLRITGLHDVLPALGEGDGAPG
jgi:anti-sigma B factor antagonist